MQPNNVITSYSIHYTKLYEDLRWKVSNTPTNGIMCVAKLLVAGNCGAKKKHIELANPMKTGSTLPDYFTQAPALYQPSNAPV